MDWGLALGAIGVVSIPATIGLTMAATTPGEFRFVRSCFIVAAALTIASFVWLTREYPLGWIKITSAGAFGAIVTISLVVALEWVTGKQAQVNKSPAQTNASQQPEIVLGISLDCRIAIIPTASLPNDVLTILEIMTDFGDGMIGEHTIPAAREALQWPG
jgi:hypothetical protein